MKRFGVALILLFAQVTLAQPQQTTIQITVPSGQAPAILSALNAILNAVGSTITQRFTTLTRTPAQGTLVLLVP